MVTIKVPFFRRADFLIPIAIATALIISVSVASAVDLERGLVAYYSFDDCSAKDLSGNGNDGIIYGAKCVDGKLGKALRFDGVNDYVEVPDSPSLDITTEATLEAWVKLKSSTDWQTIFSKGLDGRENYELLVCSDLSCLHTGWEFDIGRFTHTWSYLIPENKWTHICLRWKAPLMKLYINGEFKETWDTGASYAIPRTEPLLIGNEYGRARYFNGIIDEVRIYNRALSEEEIRALYERSVTPRPKLAIEIDIDTSLKQGEVRKGTIRVENIGNSDAKSVEVRLFSEGLGIDVEKSYAKIPSGEAREFLFEVSAHEAGTFKLSAYAEYRDDKGNKYVETADKFVHVEAVVLPTSQAQETPEARETARPAGFYAIFASLLMAVSYFLIKLRGKKN